MDAPAASPTDIAAPGPLFRRISCASGVFFALAIHLRTLTNSPLRRLDPPLGPTAQRLPSQQTHLLHHALFRSVGFRQFPLAPSTASTIDRPAGEDRDTPAKPPSAHHRSTPTDRHPNLPQIRHSKPNLLCIALNCTRFRTVCLIFERRDVRNGRISPVRARDLNARRARQTRRSA